MIKNRYIKTSLSTALCLLFKLGFAQAPTIEWQKMLGGTNMEQSYCIQQTTDSGYVVAGQTRSVNGDVSFNHASGSFDAWVIKLSKTGSIDWEKTYGGIASENAQCIKQTADGGYIVAGATNSNDGDIDTNKGGADFMVLKLDAVGNLQWTKTYGGTEDDRAFTVDETADGGYVIAGHSSSSNSDVSGHHGTFAYSDIWMIKLDPQGLLQWQKSLGGSNDEYCESLLQVTDGGYILCGRTKSNDGDVSGLHGNTYPDCWVVRLDGSGNIQWQRALGGTQSDYGNDIVQTPDGGYILASLTFSNDGDVSFLRGSGGDAWLVKLDTVGNLEWEKTYGGYNGDGAYSINKTTDSGYIIGCSSSSNDGDVSGNHGTVDCWIFKVNSVGTLQWSKAFGGSGFETTYSIQQTLDGGFVFCGDSGSNDGDCSGFHSGSGALEDIWVVKLGPEPIGLPEAPWMNTFALYPNPATDKLFVRLENNTDIYTVSLYDMAGKELKQLTGKGENTIELQLADIANGIYLLRVASGKNVITRKVVVQH